MPIRPTDYVPEYQARQTYVPLPFDDLLKAGAIKQERFDDIRDDVGELDALSKSLRPGYRTTDLSSSVKNEYNTAINNFYEKHGVSLDTPQAARDISRLKNTFATDNRVGIIQQDFKYGNKEYDELRKSKTFNLDINPNINPETGQLGQFKSSDSYQGYQALTPFSDFNKSIDAELKNIPAKIEQETGYRVFSDPKTGILMMQTAKGNIEVKDSDVFKKAIGELAEDFSMGATPESSYFMQNFAVENIDQVVDYYEGRAEQFYGKKRTGSDSFSIVPKSVTEDVIGSTPDVIDVSMWTHSDLGKEVTDAKTGFIKGLFGKTLPKYDAFIDKLETTEGELNTLKSQRKEGVTDKSLENKISNTQKIYDNLNEVNEKVESLYDSENVDGEFKIEQYDDSPQKANESFNDYQTRLESASKYKDIESKAVDVDMATFFDENINKIANTVSQYQRGVGLPNTLYDKEIAANFKSKGFKKAWGSSGDSVIPDIIIPTGTVSDLAGKGIMNMSYGYFLDEDEAEKAGGTIEEYTGDEANRMIKSIQVAAGSKGVTIPLQIFKSDDDIYRVQVWTDATTSTKEYAKNAFTGNISKSVAEFDDELNRSGVIQDMGEGVSASTVQKETGSVYHIELPNGKTYSFSDRAEAVKYGMGAVEILKSK